MGIKAIYICPDLNYGAAVHADKWIPIKPNTDAALSLAIAYCWITEGTYDKDYVATHTYGFDKFVEYVTGKEDGTPKTYEMRIGMIYEHIGTLEKSMNQIKELEKEGDQNYNQLVRWIMNKENHASKLQEIVSQYFMTQRIKPDTKDYEKKLGLLHQMLVYSMKCKQTTDLTHVKTLKGLVKEFQGLYFEKKIGD